MPAADPLPPSPRELARLFYESPDELGTFEQIAAAADLPQPYRRLLAHNEHMTVTVEKFHECKVDVQDLATRRDGHFYSRTILLTRQTDGKVVQFGIPRLNFGLLDPEVRSEIESQTKPLGRVLIDHNVMREVQLVTLFKVTPG